MKRRLAVIPARAGSTRFPGKNLSKIAGNTLVDWACSAAMRGVSWVTVSTNDPEMAGGWPFVRRPEELSGPHADIKDAVRHALLEMEGRARRAIGPGFIFDEVLTLQPTLPIRPYGLIQQMLKAKEATKARSALTVMPCVPWMWQVQGGPSAALRQAQGKHVQGGHAWNDWHPGPYPRSQDVDYGYFQEINSVTVADRDVVLAGKRWDLPLLLCELPRWAYVDIDYEEDLEEARALWPFVWDRSIGELKTHLITVINESPRFKVQSSRLKGERHDAEAENVPAQSGRH